MLKKTQVEAFSCSSLCSLRKLRFFIARFCFIVSWFFLRFLFFSTVSEFHLLAFFLLLSPRVACYLCVLHIILVTSTVFTVPLSFLVRFLMFRCLFAIFLFFLLLPLFLRCYLDFAYEFDLFSFHFTLCLVPEIHYELFLLLRLSLFIFLFASCVYSLFVIFTFTSKLVQVLGQAFVFALDILWVQIVRKRKLKEGEDDTRGCRMNERARGCDKR